jgi:hypothetical protein
MTKAIAPSTKTILQNISWIYLSYSRHQTLRLSWRGIDDFNFFSERFRQVDVKTIENLRVWINVLFYQFDRKKYIFFVPKFKGCSHCTERVLREKLLISNTIIIVKQLLIFLITSDLHFKLQSEFFHRIQFDFCCVRKFIQNLTNFQRKWKVTCITLLNLLSPSTAGYLHVNQWKTHERTKVAFKACKTPRTFTTSFDLLLKSASFTRYPSLFSFHLSHHQFTTLQMMRTTNGTVFGEIAGHTKLVVNTTSTNQIKVK